MTYSNNVNAGTATASATYAGNGNLNGSSGSKTFTIQKANQTIDFAALGNKLYGDAPFTVSATASSGLNVTFTVSGNCTSSGNTVTITGTGSCTVTAKQAGNDNYNAAQDVSRTFQITP